MSRTTFSGPLFVGDKDDPAIGGISAIDPATGAITVVTTEGVAVVNDPADIQAQIDALDARITALEP